MNGPINTRLYSLLVGAVITGSSALSWAQVPIITPQQVQKAPEVPIVRSSRTSELPTSVPIVRKPNVDKIATPHNGNALSSNELAAAQNDLQSDTGIKSSQIESTFLPVIIRPGQMIPPIVGRDAAQSTGSRPPAGSPNNAPSAFPIDQSSKQTSQGEEVGPAREIPIIRAEPITLESPPAANSPFTPRLESTFGPVVGPQLPAVNPTEMVIVAGGAEDPSMNAAQPPLLPTTYVQEGTAMPMEATPIVPAAPTPLTHLFPRSTIGSPESELNPASTGQLPVYRSPQDFAEGQLTPSNVPPMRSSFAAPGNYGPRMSPANWRMEPGLAGEYFGTPGQEPVPYDFAPGATCPHCGGTGCEYCQGATDGAVVGDGTLVNESGCWNECEPGCFGFMPCARKYLIVDGLYWTRNDGGVIGTNFGGVSDYEWEYGWRVTLGQRVDAINGYELGFFGFLPFDAQSRQTSFFGAIDANFVPAGGFGPVQTGAFYNAVETTQTIQTRLHGIELNRVRWGWDVVQSSLGLRYMWFEDDYKLQSRNIFANTGTLSLSAINQLIGPEIGLSLFYDVGRRLSFSGFGKLGGYLNFYRTDLDLINGGVQYLSNRHSDTNLSASLDLGANAHFHIASGVRLRAGYGALWLWDVTSSADNFPAVLRPTTGFTPDETDTVFFHGVNLGFEIYR